MNIQGQGAYFTLKSFNIRISKNATNFNSSNTTNYKRWGKNFIISCHRHASKKHVLFHNAECSFEEYMSSRSLPSSNFIRRNSMQHHQTRMENYYWNWLPYHLSTKISKFFWLCWHWLLILIFRKNINVYCNFLWIIFIYRSIKKLFI